MSTQARRGQSRTRTMSAAFRALITSPAGAFGMTVVAILLLSAVRLLWRLGHPPPGLPGFVRAAMPRWQRAGRTASHRLMYLLFFAVPLLGWAQSSALGVPVVWFGVLPLPDFVPKDHDLGELLESVHAWLAYGLAALVLAHVAGALKHQFIDHDGLLSRMSLRRP